MEDWQELWMEWRGVKLGPPGLEGAAGSQEVGHPRCLHLKSPQGPGWWAGLEPGGCDCLSGTGFYLSQKLNLGHCTFARSSASKSIEWGGSFLASHNMKMLENFTKEL